MFRLLPTYELAKCQDDGRPFNQRNFAQRRCGSLTSVILTFTTKHNFQLFWQYTAAFLEEAEHLHSNVLSHPEPVWLWPTVWFRSDRHFRANLEENFFVDLTTAPLRKNPERLLCFFNSVLDSSTFDFDEFRTDISNPNLTPIFVLFFFFFFFYFFFLLGPLEHVVIGE